MKTTKVNKYYREAYNNPSRYADLFSNPENINSEDKMINQICSGVGDALRDREAGTYKYI